MVLRPNNEKTTSDFIMCVCVYSKYIHLQNKSKTNDFRYQISRLFDLLNLHRITSGFRGVFARGVANQQGKLTLPYTRFRSFLDLRMYQLLRPVFTWVVSTIHLEYPSVLSRSIIERMIGLVRDPSTALYRSFLKHCALNNKAVGENMTDLIENVLSDC